MRWCCTRGSVWLVLFAACACTAARPELRSQTAEPSAPTRQEVDDAPRASPESDASLASASDGAAAESSGRYLFVATHPDDDLLLMSGDVLEAVQSGAPVQTVFMTAGNAGLPCFDYGSGREQGLRAAYADMAGVPDEWSEQAEVHQGHTVRKLRLSAAPVELLFIGLGDEPSHDVQRLWEGTASEASTWRLDTRRPLERYTRDALIGVLRALMDAFRPTRVGFNDASDLRPLTWPFDHPDHVHSGMFVLAALEQHDGAPEQRMYRAYNIQFERPNLPTDLATRTWEVFERYASNDAKMCSGGLTTICGARTTCDPLATFYVPLSGRQYYVSMIRGVGPLAVPGNGCLGVDGSSLVAVDCARAATWELSAADEVRQLGSGQCLSASAREAGLVALAPCSGLPEQRFRLTTEGQLRGPLASCVALRNGALALQECADQKEQRGFALHEVVAPANEGSRDVQ